MAVEQLLASADGQGPPGAPRFPMSACRTMTTSGRRHSRTNGAEICGKPASQRTEHRRPFRLIEIGQVKDPLLQSARLEQPRPLDAGEATRFQ